MTAPPPLPGLPLRAVVIGAGFAGLAAARCLRDAGVEVVVLERGDDVGGVWRDNTYPGAACDVPSSLYSYSFDAGRDWERVYSEQPAILDYLRDVADDHGLRPLVRCGARVVGAVLDDADGTWSVRLDGGETLVADLVIAAVGQLSEPLVPRIPGRDLFAGPAFHSAAWRHDVDLAGRHVAVVGTGASAIQFVPRLAEVAASVTVFQRSAPYVVPKPDAAYPRPLRRLLQAVPALRGLERRAVRHLTERLNRALSGEVPRSRLPGALRRVWRLHLRRQVGDPALRERLEPIDPLGCKRLLFSNDWYRALARPNVDVVTERVEGLTSEYVVDASGRRHRADVVVWGTGFAATDFLRGIEVVGRGGEYLHERWSGGASAHLGVSVPGFPGLLVMYGPNTNLGGSSILGMIEPQAAYAAQLAGALARARARGAVALDVRAEAAAAYDAEMQHRLARSVWAGCASWYRTAGGRITTNWPGTVAEYRRRTARLDTAAFADVRAPVRAQVRA